MDQGIPHSEFLSWPEDDQDKVIAFLMLKNETCEMCGTREDDWIDPETGRLLDEPRYTPVDIKCHGCAQKANYRNQVFKDGTPDGVNIVLWPSRDVDPRGNILSKQSKQT